MVRSVVVAVGVALLWSTAATLPATAAPQVRIESVDLQPDGTSTLVFRTSPETGVIGPEDIVVREDGNPVEGLTVDLLTVPEDREPLNLAVAMDVSGSTAGEPIEAAKSAADALVRDVVERGVQVVLLSFGDSAELLVGPTDDLAVLSAAIAGLEAGGDTALNDAVLLAVQTVFDAGVDGRVLLFTDGADDGNSTSLSTVLDAVGVAQVPVSSIVLESAATDTRALQQVAAVAGGTVASVGSASELAGAFEQAVTELPALHRASWVSQRRDSGELALSVEVATAAGLLRDEALVINPRRGVATPPRTLEPPSTGPLAAGAGMVALGLLGTGLAGLLVLLLVPRRGAPIRRTLAVAAGEQGRGRQFTLSPRRRDRDARDHGPGLTARAAALLESVPAPRLHEDEVALRIERAGWALRPAEFQVVRIAATGLFLVMGFGLAQNVLVAAGIAVAGFWLPGALADRAHRRRQQAFVEQLPDVLQLLAGSLKAGYGLVQAIDLVVEESRPPISDEFGRVVSEHLLGLELEEALTALADRIDSEDLRWVVVAMNVQRRVGGNLAELLETVASTLRERAAVKRHVKSLSAEGRLSARILTVMPFFIGGYVALVNPDYIAVLFTDPRGRVMLVASLVMMVLGSLWMRRLVDVDV